MCWGEGQSQRLKLMLQPSISSSELPALEENAVNSAKRTDASGGHGGHGPGGGIVVSFSNCSPKNQRAISHTVRLDEEMKIYVHVGLGIIPAGHT